MKCIGYMYTYTQASQVVLVVKNQPANAADVKRLGFDPWVGKILWRRAWQSIPVFLPGEFYGQRNLAGYSPWDCKEWDTTEQLTLSLYFFFLGRTHYFIWSSEQQYQLVIIIIFTLNMINATLLFSQQYLANIIVSR